MRSLKRGDYVLATKYSDGGPCDQFCIGFFREMLVDCAGNLTDHYLVEDKNGVLFRGSGFRRCEKIPAKIGNVMVKALSIIGDKPGRSLWYWRYHPKQLKDLVNCLNA